MELPTRRHVSAAPRGFGWRYCKPRFFLHETDSISESALEKLVLARPYPVTLFSGCYFNGCLVSRLERKSWRRRFDCEQSVAGSCFALVRVGGVLDLQNERSALVRRQPCAPDSSNSDGSLFYFRNGSKRRLAVVRT